MSTYPDQRTRLEEQDRSFAEAEAFWEKFERFAEVSHEESESYERLPE